ncbi:MAG: hypothetical protein AAF731_04800 [Bacteroidota bacterium]
MSKTDDFSSNASDMNPNNISPEEQRAQLQEEHSQELRTIAERHGRQINNIVHNLDEPDFIKERRINLCNEKHLDTLTLTMGGQDREKLRLEVELKRQWDKEHLNKAFDTTHAERILKIRHDHFAKEQSDPSIDQDFARHQVEFDTVIKDYLDGKTSYEQFVREHDRTINRQMLEGAHDYETETQEKDISKEQNRDQEQDKNPDIDI